MRQRIIKRKTLARWLAVFVTVLLMPWSMWLSGDMGTLDAAEMTETTITPLENLEIWTPGDAGVEYGKELNNGILGTVSSEAGSLNGTAFKTKVKFPTATEIGTGNVVYINIGGTAGTSSRTYVLGAVADGDYLRLVPYSGGTVQNADIQKLTPEDFGMEGTTLLGQELEVVITTEFENYTAASGDAQATADIKVGIYINGVMYKGDYVTLSGYTITNFKKQVQIEKSEDAPGPILKPIITSPEDLTPWTPADAGFSYGTTETSGITGEVSADAGSLDGTAFKTRIKFPSAVGQGENVNLYIGGSDTTRPYLLQTLNNYVRFLTYDSGGSDANNKVIELNASDFGLTTWFGEEFELTVTTEFINYNDTKTTADVNLGLYINDVLYNGNYIKLEDYTISDSVGCFTQQIKIVYNCAAGGPIFSASSGEIVTPVLEKFDIWTPQDTGLSYGVTLTTNVGGTVDDTAGSLNGSVFQTKVLFPSGTDKNAAFLNVGGNTSARSYRLGVDPSGPGLNFLPYNGGEADVNKRIYFEPDDFNMTGDTLLGRELDLMITTEFTNAVTSEGTIKADVTVGIYINGTLYTGGYIRLIDYDVTYYRKVMQIELSEGESLTLETPDEIAFGDLNYDRACNSVDLVRGKHVLARKLYYKSFDFYRDGASGEEDLSLLRRQLLGEEPTIAYTKYLTFADFNISEDTTVSYDAEKDGLAQHSLSSDGADDNTLDGVFLEGTYNFAGQNFVLDIGKASWGGLQFQNGAGETLKYLFSNDGTAVEGTAKTVSAAVAGVDSIIGSDVDISVGFTFRNQDTTNGTVDVTIEVYIGSDYYDRFTVQDAKTTSLTRSIFMYAGASGDSITLRVGERLYNTTLGLNDFVVSGESGHTGISTAETIYTTYANNNNQKKSTVLTAAEAYTGNLDNVLLEGIYRFQGSSWILEIGAEWGGIQIVPSTGTGSLDLRYADIATSNGGKGTTILHTLTPAEANYESFLDTDIDVSVGLVFANADATTNTVDVTVEFRIGTYRKSFTVKGVSTTNLNRIIHLYTDETSDSITLVAPVATLSFDAIGGDEVLPIGGFYGPALPQSITGTNGAIYDHYTEENFEKIADAGVNLLLCPNARYDYSATEQSLVEKTLDLASKYGIGVFVTDTHFTTATTASSISQVATQIQLAKYRHKAAFCGVHVVDEPFSDNWLPSGKTAEDSSVAARWMANFAPLYQTLSKLGVVGSTNLNPRKSGNDAEYATYAAYVEEYCTTCDPAYLSFDYYVWDGDTTVANYFRNMSIVREYAGKHNIPFWSFVQAGGYWNDSAAELTENDPYVTEAKFHWNVNTALACGAKGISYFPLIQPNHFSFSSDDTPLYTRNGLIGADGSLNTWYGYAQAANKQIEKVDAVLMKAVNKGIITSGTTTFTKNASLTATDISTDTANFGAKLNAAWEELASVSGDALIGCFKHENKTALYVVNYNYASTSSSSKDTITLTFDANYKWVQTKEGVQTTVTTTDKTLTLCMAGGEGVLLVLQ